MATGICEYLIAAGISKDCTDPIKPGLEKRGVIINRADIDFGKVTYSEDNPNIISALPLKSGKKAYNIYQQTNTPFNGTNKAFAAGTNSNSFTKQVAFIVQDDGPDVARDIIDPLANGEFVVILENKYKKLQGTPAGAAAFEVYGFDTGLKQSEGTDDKNSADTDGCWAITLQETSAPRSGLFLFSESYDATVTLIDGLVAGTVPGV